MGFPLLSILIWLPIIVAVLLMCLSSKLKPNESRWIALTVAVVSMVLSVFMFVQFDRSSYAMQFAEYHSWIPSLKIFYHIGVDGIGMPLVALSCLTTLLVIMASWRLVQKKVTAYLATFLLLHGAIVGVFSSLDSMLFYFFWEAMLIPMYLSIGIWGMKNRNYAATKFFLYTFFGSALMLVALIYLRIQTHSFEIASFYTLHAPLMIQVLLFFGFFMAFAVKIPIWPLHTWLPDAHTEAPTGGSVVLAALMLKLGSYGFLRFTLPILPDACRYLDSFMIILALISIVYIAFVALSQTDMKRLIAYSSIAHMGFVTLGCFMLYLVIGHSGVYADAYLGLEGAMVQMISHAFGSGAMFLAFGMLYNQMHTREISQFGGIAKVMPFFTACFVLFAFSNIGLPGTSGFVGEFMVIMSAIKVNFWVGMLAATSLVIGAAYTLFMVKRVFYGPIINDNVMQLKDVCGFSRLLLISFVVFILWLGFYPNVLLNVMHATIGHILDVSMQSRL